MRVPKMAHDRSPTEISCELDDVEDLVFLHKTLEANGVDLLESGCISKRDGLRGRFVTLDPGTCRSVLTDLCVAWEEVDRADPADLGRTDRLDAEARRFADGAKTLLEETQDGLAQDP